MTQGSRAEPGTCEPVWGLWGQGLGAGFAWVGVVQLSLGQLVGPVAGLPAGWTGCSWLTLAALGENAGHTPGTREFDIEGGT